MIGQHQILQRHDQSASHCGQISVVFREERKQIGRGQFLLAGLKVQLIAAWSVLRDSDHRRLSIFTLFTPVALFTFFAGVSLFALQALLTGIALGVLDALFAFLAGVSLFALRALLAGIALGAGVAPDALRAPWPHGTHRTAGSCRAGTALVALDATGSHGGPAHPGHPVRPADPPAP